MTEYATTAGLAEREDDRHPNEEDRERGREMKEGQVGKGKEGDEQKSTDQQNAPDPNPPKDPGGRS